MSKDGIYLHGKPEIILCSSLFYFRIPQGLWKDRLKKVKESGYNCIDVYFPWNFHESEKGVWDFSGQKDVALFLEMAAEEGLYVIARPGPYICSEWDGGGLPAYLFTDQEMKIRGYDEKFLTHVSRWFDQILPLLKKYEWGQQGTIISVQLENELDFYGSHLRREYISALRDMALSHELTVPLFACAGQGDLYGATGDAEGVMPACNFYPHDKDPHLEKLVWQYYQELQEKDFPLCVTETNRAHFLLRRLLSVGAKLLGPYNQVSGTDFGFTNGINNWGDPMTFLTSDYDFHGMVTPEGVRREEFYEGVLLARLIKTLGTRLAEAHPKPLTALEVSTEMPLPEAGFTQLVLPGGGSVVFLPNLGEEAYDVHLRNARVDTTMTVEQDRCPMVLYDLPLQAWNISGKINYATAELLTVKQWDDQTVMVFHTENSGEVMIQVEGKYTLTNEQGRQSEQTGDCLFSFTSQENKKISITLESGQVLTILGVSREQASRIEEVRDDHQLIFKDSPQEEEEERIFQAEWAFAENQQEELALNGFTIDEPQSMEESGFLKGYGVYTSHYENQQAKPNLGILVHGASDVVSLYTNDEFQGVSTPGGGFHYYSYKEQDAASLDLSVRTEIWGHSNFHDPRLPALKLNALKGLEDVTIVHEISPLQTGWHYLSATHVTDQKIPFTPDHHHWKKTNYGGFLTGEAFKKGYYVKEVQMDSAYTNYVLHFPGIKTPGKVFIDYECVSEINPLNPYVDISAEVKQKDSVLVIIYIEEHYGASVGSVDLMKGNRAENWKIHGFQEDDLITLGKKKQEESQGTAFPLKMEPGKTGWLTANLQKDEQDKRCYLAYPAGENVKLTAFFNGELVGRVWLPSKTRPQFTGGHQGRFYLPSPFWKDDNQFFIFVEAIEQDEAGIIREIEFSSVEEPS